MKRFYESLLNRISLKALTVLCTVLLAIAGGAIAEYLGYSMQHSATKWTFGGNEVVELHVAAGDMFRAISRISVAQCPWNVSYLPLHLPQPGAKIESVTIGDRKIPLTAGDVRLSFKTDPEKEKDTYYAMAAMPGQALKNDLIEVVWSYPMADALRQGCGYQFPLQGLIPVKTLTANVVIDEGVPYRFADRFADRRDYNMFYKSNWDYSECKYGYCGIALEPSGS